MTERGELGWCMVGSLEAGGIISHEFYRRCFLVNSIKLNNGSVAPVIESCSDAWVF